MKMNRPKNNAKKTQRTYNDDQEDLGYIDYLFADDEMEDGMDDFDGADEMNYFDETDEMYTSDADCNDNKKKSYWLLRSELASWATTSGRGNTLSSLTHLLKILRPYGFSNLPEDSRALMNTPRESNSLIRDVFPGQYIHIGLQKGIEFQLKQNGVDVNQLTVVVIDCDMDGVRICKSSIHTF